MPTGMAANRSRSDSRKLHKGLCRKKWDTRKCCLLSRVCTKQNVGRKLQNFAKLNLLSGGVGDHPFVGFRQILRVI